MARYGYKALGALIAATAVMAAVLGCSEQEVREVSLEKRTVLKPFSSAIRRNHLRIGMGALVSPKVGYLYYQPLGKYLEEKLGMPIQLVDRDTYDQVNRHLKSGDLDAAFVCSGPYVIGHDTFGLEIIAAPVVDGLATYHSYLIVPRESSANSIEDLRGKVFAFTDPLSNTGKIIPSYLLWLKQESPQAFFQKSFYTYGHDRSIKAVADKLVDGAAVDGFIWEFTNKKDPTLTGRTRIIYKSVPSAAPPFAAGPHLDPAVKGLLRSILLAMHNDPEGKEILARMMVDRFTVTRDQDYDSIRGMRALLARKTEGH